MERHQMPLMENGVSTASGQHAPELVVVVSNTEKEAVIVQLRSLVVFIAPERIRNTECATQRYVIAKNLLSLIFLYFYVKK